MKRAQRNRIKMEKALRGKHGPDRAMADLDLAVKKYGGTLRANFLASGYRTIDEYIYEIRGRSAFEGLKPIKELDDTV